MGGKITSRNSGVAWLTGPIHVCTRAGGKHLSSTVLPSGNDCPFGADQFSALPSQRNRTTSFLGDRPKRLWNSGESMLLLTRL